MVASLLLPHTLSRTLWSVHEARGAALHMLAEVLWRLVQFAINNNNNNLFNVYTYNDRPYILIFNFVILYNTHIYVRVTLSQKAVSETDRVPIIVFTILIALHFTLGMVINFRYF